METVERSAPWAWVAGAFERVGACGVADVPAAASYGVQTNVFIGKNSAVGLCDEVHAVSNNVVETHLIAILVKFLQDSRAQRFVGRRFQRGE
jgi:hypothetical protein